MPKKASARVVQMVVIDKKLLNSLCVRVLLILEHMPIADQERHRHEYAIGPELPFAAFCISMPKTTVFCSRIRIENLSDLVGTALVFQLSRLFKENEAKISRQHVIKSVYRTIDGSLIVNMKVDPCPDVVKIPLVASPKVNQIFPVEVERFGIAPAL
jgi:hypothetical protein